MITEQYLHELNLRSDERKQKIINSSSEINPAGNIFYVSNNGDDRNDGKSPGTAWATLDRVNSFSYAKDDAVLFERGGLWRGQLQCCGDVAYSAYGISEKPKIYGSEHRSEERRVG